MAFWPTGGDITSVDHTTPSVGIVQHFIKHTIHIKQSADNQINIMEHIFAVVIWMKSYNFYGVSATVSRNECEGRSVCSFLPVQRSSSLAAQPLLLISVKQCHYMHVCVI